MMSFKHFIICTLSVLALIISSCAGEIVTLNDANFEHQTQASTGMTTGSWLLFFKANRCPHCKKVEPEFFKLSQDEELAEQGVVLGHVNVMESPRCAGRMGIRGFPTLIYLHQRKLFRYNGKRDAESIKEFIINGVQDMEGEDIPAPPSFLDHVLKMFKAVGLELYDAALGKSGMAGYGIIVMVGVLMAIFIGIISMFFMPAQKIKKA
jgi:thiol-disulfide isomerase/thioredoxin